MEPSFMEEKVSQDEWKLYGGSTRKENIMVDKVSGEFPIPPDSDMFPEKIKED